MRRPWLIASALPALALCGPMPGLVAAQDPPAAPPGATVPDALPRSEDLIDEPSVAGERLEKIKDSLRENAEAITDPAERSLALVAVASSRLFTNDLDDARTALLAAGRAADEVKDPVFHDLRAMAVVRTMMELIDAYTREASLGERSLDSDADLPLPGDETPAPTETKPATKLDRGAMLGRIEEVGAEATRLTDALNNRTYRSELRVLIARSLSFAATRVYQALPPLDPRSDLTDEVIDALKAGSARLFEQATQVAHAIPRVIWRDRALVYVTMNAAAAKQYRTADRVARSIPAAEIRYEALGRLGDALARDKRPEEATVAFQESAKAVAAIPNEDPRNIAVGYLIQVMVAVGRFEDARKAAVMYTNKVQRLLAMGAVAESMGKRGLGRAARDWIKADETAENQSYLLRRVAQGEIDAVRQNKSQALMEIEPIDFDPPPSTTPDDSTPP